MSLETNRFRSQELKDINIATQRYLRLAANDSGLSDLEIAIKAGLPQSTVYRVLNAKTQNPSYSIVFKLCKVLGVGLPNTLLSDDPTKTVLVLHHSPVETINRNLNTEFQNEESLLKTSSTKRAILLDDCGDLYFPVKSNIIYNVINNPNEIRNGDKLIIKVTGPNQTITIPILIMSSPKEEHWILYQLTKNTLCHRTFSIPKNSLIAINNDQNITIVGKIKDSLIQDS